MLGRKPRKSSMLINTDLDEDEDFYDEDHDDFEETLEKINEGKIVEFKYLATFCIKYFKSNQPFSIFL